jgi:diguanylate cyclase (GGDEF)-like protein
MKFEPAAKILIIYDQSSGHNSIRKNLRNENYQIFEAANPKDGLTVFERENPDLVLLNLTLPHMRDKALLQSLKKSEKSGVYIPVIIIAEKSIEENLVKGLKSGADDYIVQPIKFSELNARINSALRIKQLNETLNKKNRELRKNVYNLHSIFEISMEMTATLDLNRLINLTLLTLIGQFSCNNAMVLYAADHSSEKMDILDTRGFYESKTKNIIVEKSDDLIRYLEKQRSPVTVDKILKNVTASRALDQLLSFNIEIVGPLNVQGNIEGLVCLGPRVKNQHYSQLDIENLTILNNIISISIHNAFLYRQVEALSYTDSMTGLHNYRYFELRLNEEMISHQRTKTELSLLLLDVDHFKNYNDTMGHPAGNEILRKIANILRTTVRENDIVVRYGGEEFAIILPVVEEDGAKILANRLCRTVEQTYFEGEENQPGGKVTISVGGASFPQEAGSVEELIHKADTALYKAKHNGRNTVVIHQT